MSKAKELWLALQKRSKPLHDALLKALARQKLHAGRGEFYKPEPVYWEPPDGASDDVRRAFPGGPQEAGYMARSAAWQRFTHRAKQFG